MRARARERRKRKETKKKKQREIERASSLLCPQKVAAFSCSLEAKGEKEVFEAPPPP